MTLSEEYEMQSKFTVCPATAIVVLFFFQNKTVAAERSQLIDNINEAFKAYHMGIVYVLEIKVNEFTSIHKLL